MANFFQNKKLKLSNLPVFTDGGLLVVDVYKTSRGIIVKSTVAGADTDHLEIFYGGNILTIQGSRHRDENVPEENFYYQECYFGSFSRSLKILEDIDPKSISASLENGILTIKLPFREIES